MNGSIRKGNAGRGRRILDWVLSDWFWEVCLMLVVAPVVIHSFLSIGTGVAA